MNSTLRLCIKKTNRHLYLYVLNKDTQLISLSTDNRMFKKHFTNLKRKYHAEALSYLLTKKLQSAGLSTVHVLQTYPFQGKIRRIINTLSLHGIHIN